MSVPIGRHVGEECLGAPGVVHLCMRGLGALLLLAQSLLHHLPRTGGGSEQAAHRAIKRGGQRTA